MRVLATCHYFLWHWHACTFLLPSFIQLPLLHVCACVWHNNKRDTHTHIHSHISCHCHWLSVEALLYENVDADEDEDADKDADVPCWSCCCLSLFLLLLLFFCLAIVAVAYIDIVVKSFKVFILFSLSHFHSILLCCLFCHFHFFSRTIFRIFHWN